MDLKKRRVLASHADDRFRIRPQVQGTEHLADGPVTERGVEPFGVVVAGPHGEQELMRAVAARQAARDDRVRVRAANAELGTGLTKRIDAAGALQAVPAAQAGFAEAALRLLRVIALPHRVDVRGLGRVDEHD